MRPTTSLTLPSFLLALLALLATAASWAQGEAEKRAPDVLVKDVTLEVVEIISRDKAIQSGDRAKLIGVIEEKVLPHFNFNYMTAAAVGQPWRSATKEQKARLVDEFRTLLVRTYASALAAYRDQRFEFRPLRAKPTDTDVTVQVRVHQSGGQPVPIDYAMEKTPSGWKVYNVQVGGVSFVANYRSDFAGVLRREGVDGLIRVLAEKNRGLDAPQAGAQAQAR
ncbi:MAG TPA: ABC transporter substrate-binding protein [Burkholderiales bacterium]|nr:ABC transporter substrate-binding protein [Burkholderiales bacterium]